jgi:hypothetical protein
MKSFADALRGLPMLGRWVILGALIAGVTGGVVGLVVGLFAYPPTAPVAVVELGYPAALAGALVGLVAAMTAATASRIRRHAVRPEALGSEQRP